MITASLPPVIAALLPPIETLHLRSFVVLAAMSVHLALCSEPSLRMLPFFRWREEIRAFLTRLDVKLNRERRPKADRWVRGTIVTAFLLWGAVMAGQMVALLLPHLPSAWVLETTLLALLLHVRPSLDVATSMRDDAKDVSLQRFREYGAQLSAQDMGLLDAPAIHRAAVAGLSRQQMEQWIAWPCVYLLGGWVWLSVWVGFAALYRAWGHPFPRWLIFAQWVHVGYGGLYLPFAVMHGFWLFLVSIITPGGHSGKAFSAGLASLSHPLQLPGVVASNAAGMAFGGETVVAGQRFRTRIYGQGVTKAADHHLRQAVKLLVASAMLWLALGIAGYLWWSDQTGLRPPLSVLSW
jgi:cobalamin biosynthesis protein CobD/CbiB